MTNLNEMAEFKRPFPHVPLNGTVDNGSLPSLLTISKGQEIAGLQALQHPRLKRFIDNNKRWFTHHQNRDAVIYLGPDGEVIP